jgi:Flp pilus assembly protein CpaB
MRKLNVSIVVGVIVAVLGAGIVVAYGQSVDKRAAGGKNPVSVLVADGDLAAGTPASEVASSVHLAKMPAAYAVDGALSDARSLTSTVGSHSVLTGPVPKGGQLSRSSFAETAVAGHVKPAPGHVAISVETDLSPGVARYLSVGSLVDVFATYHDVRGAGGQLSNASSRTKLFASGIKVLAVSVAQEPAGDSHTNSSALLDKVVALLDMTPGAAEKLVNATTLGDIYLAETQSGHDITATGAVPSDVVSSNH